MAANSSDQHEPGIGCNRRQMLVAGNLADADKGEANGLHT
jgi:hypothetical protein